jgi:Sigma-70 region 2
VDQTRWLTDQFEADRPHLRALAFRILGNVEDADDALQETWLRLSTTDAGDIGNITGWLTTVVSRICLNMLRSRHRRPFASTDDLPTASGSPRELRSLLRIRPSSPTPSAARSSSFSTGSRPPSGSPSFSTTPSPSPTRRSPGSWASLQKPADSLRAGLVVGFAHWRIPPPIRSDSAR